MIKVLLSRKMANTGKVSDIQSRSYLTSLYSNNETRRCAKIVFVFEKSNLFRVTAFIRIFRERRLEQLSGQEDQYENYASGRFFREKANDCNLLSSQCQKKHFR